MNDRWTCSCKSEEGPEVEGRFGLSAIVTKLDEWKLRRFMFIRGSRSIGLALREKRSFWNWILYIAALKTSHTGAGGMLFLVTASE